MRSPEGILFVGSDHLIQSVVAICLTEWHGPRAYGENNDAQGEQVRRDGLVAHVEQDLRCHVGEWSYSLMAGAAAILILNRAGKTKVDDFQVEIRVEDQILQFEIPMADACPVYRDQA